MPGGVTARFVYRETRQVEKIRRGVLPGRGKFLFSRWFLRKNGHCATRGESASSQERQQPWPARGLWNYFLRELRNFYPISAAASGIKRLCAHVSMGFRKMFTSTRWEGMRKRKREGLTVNCIAHWLLIESYGIHAGSDTLARDVKDHFTLRSESVN